MAIKALATDLAKRIRGTGDRLFEKDDALARRNGWTIEVRRRGLARTYRDPRFDRLSRCPDCGGSGEDALGLKCEPCSGDGRVTLGRQPSLAGR
jgi:hypothetical protein